MVEATEKQRLLGALISLAVYSAIYVTMVVKPRSWMGFYYEH